MFVTIIIYVIIGNRIRSMANDAICKCTGNCMHGHTRILTNTHTHTHTQARANACYKKHFEHLFSILQYQFFFRVRTHHAVFWCQSYAYTICAKMNSTKLCFSIIIFDVLSQGQAAKEWHTAASVVFSTEAVRNLHNVIFFHFLHVSCTSKYDCRRWVLCLILFILFAPSLRNLFLQFQPLLLWFSTVIIRFRRISSRVACGCWSGASLWSGWLSVPGKRLHPTCKSRASHRRLLGYPTVVVYSRPHCLVVLFPIYRQHSNIKHPFSSECDHVWQQLGQDCTHVQVLGLSPCVRVVFSPTPAQSCRSCCWSPMEGWAEKDGCRDQARLDSDGWWKGWLPRTHSKVPLLHLPWVGHKQGTPYGVLWHSRGMFVAAIYWTFDSLNVWHR